MGKPTGFWIFPARRRHDGRSTSGSTTFSRSTTRSPSRSSRPRRALHGLRHPVLPPGLPARQPDPRLERPGLPRPVAGGHRPAARDATTSPSSPASSAPPRARPRACWGSTTTPSRSSRSSRASSTGPGKRAGSCPSRPRSRPARRSPSSAPARPGWPPPSSSPAAGHAVTVFERADRIGGLLRYGIPDFKMEKRRLDRRVEQMEAEGRRLQAERECRRRPLGRRASRRVRRHLPLRRRDPAARPADPGPRAQGHPFRHGLPPAPEPAGRRRHVPDDAFLTAEGQARDHHRRRRHRGRLPGHRPPPGLQERPPVRDRPPTARLARLRRTPGRSGRTSSASPRRTRKGASANTRSTPSASSARTAA